MDAKIDSIQLTMSSILEEVKHIRNTGLEMPQDKQFETQNNGFDY